jgi:DHA3 family tetracycline resistance protein-like MFS transporter
MKLDPAVAYRVIRFGEGFFMSLYWTLALVFQVQAVGLGPLQLVLMGTIYEIAILSLEVPTGVVADLYSRKISILIGFVIMGVAMVMQSGPPTVLIVAAAQVVLGLGETFVSGAREAWITDELAHSKESTLAPGKLFVMGSQLELMGRFLGAWGVLLFVRQGLGIVLLAAGVGYISLAIFGWLAMSEHGFERARHGESFFKNFAEGWTAVRTSKLLIGILSVSVIFGLASEGYDRLSTKHILSQFEFPAFPGGLPNEAWWALFTSSACILAVLAQGGMRRVVDFSNSRSIATALILLTAVQCAFIGMFAWAPSMWFTVSILVVVRVIRRCVSPLMTSWLNLNANSKQRATILSFEGQSHSFGEIVGGPGVGAIGQFASVRTALFCAAVMLVPALPLIIAARQKTPQTGDHAPA